VSATRLGTVGGDQLSIAIDHDSYGWHVGNLHDTWFHTIARAMTV
jgi:hypothetical protein